MWVQMWQEQRAVRDPGARGPLRSFPWASMVEEQKDPKWRVVMMATASSLADVHLLCMAALGEVIWGPSPGDLGTAITAQFDQVRRPQVKKATCSLRALTAQLVGGVRERRSNSLFPWHPPQALAADSTWCLHVTGLKNRYGFIEDGGINTCPRPGLLGGCGARACCAGSRDREGKTWL